MIYVGAYGILAKKKAINSILILANSLFCGSKVLFLGNCDIPEGLELVKLNYLLLNNSAYFPYKDVRFYYHKNIHKIKKLFNNFKFDIVVVYADNPEKIQMDIFKTVAYFSFGIGDLYTRSEIFDYYIPGI
jgi:hypothetical protein